VTLSPKRLAAVRGMAQTILAILAAAVAAITAFNVLTQDHGDPARQLLEQKVETKP
jgi:hypothetical protein